MKTADLPAFRTTCWGCDHAISVHPPRFACPKCGGEQAPERLAREWLKAEAPGVVLLWLDDAIDVLASQVAMHTVYGWERGTDEWRAHPMHDRLGPAIENVRKILANVPRDSRTTTRAIVLTYLRHSLRRRRRQVQRPTFA